MNIPTEVRQAVAIIWVTIAVSALSALFSKMTGLYSEGEFMGALFVYSLLCIFPYKLRTGSNAARYGYVILTVMTVLIMLAGIGADKKLDLYVSLLLLPAEVFIIYRLFQKESSLWFYSR